MRHLPGSSRVLRPRPQAPRDCDLRMYAGRVSADLMPRVFSTAGLPAARRVELWEEHNATALIGLAVRTERPLEATELNIRLPRLHLARLVGSPHVVDRP